jgi:hypothetical protein
MPDDFCDVRRYVRAIAGHQRRRLRAG